MAFMEEEKVLLIDPIDKQKEKLKKTISEIDDLLQQRSHYGYGKAFILHFFSIAVCSLLSFFYSNLVILNQIASIGGLFGFVGVYVAHRFKDRRIAQILKEHTLEESCFFQGSVNDTEKNSLLGMTKMAQLRAEKTHRDFLRALQGSLDRLIENAQDYPGSLEIFYQTVLHYNHTSFSQRMNPFRERGKEILPDRFWAKIYCEAARQKNQELMQRIQLDYLRAKSGTNNISGFQAAINAEAQAKGLLDLTLPTSHMKELPTPVYNRGQSLSLRLISISRFFGTDLVLNIADIKIYLTKQVVMANQIQLSMGAATTGTFLGLSLTNLIPLSVGVIGLGIVAYGMRIAFREYIRYQIKDKTLVDLMRMHHCSQDDRWLSMIHLKISGIMKSKPLAEMKAQLNLNCEFQGVDIAPFRLDSFERQSLFFVISSYIETHRGQRPLIKGNQLSFEQIKAIREELEGQGEDFRKMVKDFLPDVGNQDQFEKFDKAIWYWKWQENLESLFFPITTVLNLMMSSLVLIVPLTVIVAACFVTLIPAACTIGVGLGLYVTSKILAMNRNNHIKELDLIFLLSQSESPYFAKVFQKKLDLILQHGTPQERMGLIEAIKSISSDDIKPKMTKYRDIALRRLSKGLEVVKNPDRQEIQNKLEPANIGINNLRRQLK